MHVGKSAFPKEGQLKVGVMTGHIENADLFCRSSDGKYFLVGQPEGQFSVQLHNQAKGRRMEVIVAIDGYDVIKGDKATLSTSGLILEPGFEVTLSAWGSTDDGFKFKSFQPSQDFSQPETGVIAVAAFLEDHSDVPRRRGSSPDIEPVEAPLNIEFFSKHKAYALPIPLELGAGFNRNLRPREFIRSPHHAALQVVIGYGEARALDELGVLRHAEPNGFSS